MGWSQRVIKPRRLAWKQHCQSFHQINTLYIFICFLSAYECTAVCEGFRNYLNLQWLIACTRFTCIEKLTCSKAGVHTRCVHLCHFQVSCYQAWSILIPESSYFLKSPFTLFVSITFTVHNKISMTSLLKCRIGSFLKFFALKAVQQRSVECNHRIQ